MDHCRMREAVSPQPPELAAGAEYGVEPEPDGSDRQLSAMERHAQAAVNLLRTKRLVTTVGNYEVRTTLTTSDGMRYHCRVRRRGAARCRGFWPRLLDRMRRLRAGTGMPDTRRVALALEAVEAHAARCAALSARAAEPRPQPSRPAWVGVLILLLTAPPVTYIAWRAPLAASTTLALGLLLALVGSLLGCSWFRRSPRATQKLILFDREYRLSTVALVVGLVGCFLVGVPLARFAVMPQAETPEGPFPASQQAELPTEGAPSVALQPHGASGEGESQRPQALGPSPLTGKWTMTNTVLETSHPPYQGLQLGFQLVIQQHGMRFTAEGVKASENGRPIRGSAHRPIRITGTIAAGALIDATFEETGRSRPIHGRFTLTMRNRNHLHGTFVATAAGVRGVSQWIRRD
jgi:hypothetical protein